MSTEVVRTERRAAIAPVDEASQVMSLLAAGLERGVPPESLEKLVLLHEHIQRRNAELEFSRALVAFQDDCPVIPRSSTAKIVTGSGSGYEYKFADYEQIMETIRPSLTKHGLSVSFDASAAGPLLKCTCTLRHSNGHSAMSSFELPTENKSGATPQQKYGGALTYAKRMTLIAILGLTLGDPDPENVSDPTPVTSDALANIRALLAEVCPTEPEAQRFYKFMGVTRLEDIRQTRYAEAIRALENKRKAGAK
jgi:hypothetical protein